MTLLDTIFPKRAARALVADIARDIWTESPDRVEELFAEIETLLALEDPALLRAAAKKRGAEIAPSEAFSVADGVAHIPIKGHILKGSNWVLDLFGIQYTSADGARTAIEHARSDPAVKSIMLNVDSPGGTVSGVQELADAVFDTRGLKPINAHATGMAASAAYWVASQADHFSAERSAVIGSIGVYTTITDSSRAAENEGFKVHAIRSGPHKGVGIPGTEVTEAHIKEIQARVDKIAGLFVSSVARGRGKSPEAIKPLATGQDWLADDALAVGLIDSIESQAVAHKATAQAAGLLPPASTTQTPEEGEAMENKDIAAQLAAVQSELQTLREDKAKSEALAQATAKALEENAKMLADIKAQRRDEILAAGVKAGRIAPAQLPFLQKQMAAAEAAELQAYVDAMPVQTRAGAVGGSPDRAEDSVVDAEQAEVNAAFGISEETHKKYGAFNAVSSDRKLMVVGPAQKAVQS